MLIVVIRCFSQMEVYIPDNQTGGSIDRYILGQRGEGLGNFFSKVFRFVKPLVGKAINTIQPELSAIGTKLIDSASGAAVNQIEKTRQRATAKLKRKQDHLDE